MSQRTLIILSALGGAAALFVILLVLNLAASHAHIDCPYIDTPVGQPLTGSDIAWARYSFGDRVVDHCWPGTPPAPAP